jgi:hypothetical protein
MMYITTDEFGTRKWYEDGEIHRDNGPAVEQINGTCIWYQFGLIHRNDGPAILHNDGTSEWWMHGEPITMNFMPND